MNPFGVLVFEDAGATAAGCSVNGTALQQIANRPIAHHALDVLESVGVREVVVASSSDHAEDIRRGLGDHAERPGISLNYVHAPGPLDFTAALTLAAPVVGRAPCVVHLASGLLSEPLAPFVTHLSGDSPDLVLIVHQGGASDSHLSRATMEMLRVAEIDPERPVLGMTGIWLFGPGALRRVVDAAVPARGEIDLDAIARAITAAGGAFHVRLAESWSSYSGSSTELLELNRIALDRLEATATTPARNGNQIEGRVSIHDAADVRASVVVGPTVIGPGARVADAYIGPYTSVGAGARIEGAEVERSIISDGATIMHVGGRLASSVVGRDARIVRDFSLPRALRLIVGEGTEVSLC